MSDEDRTRILRNTSAQPPLPEPAGPGSEATRIIRSGGSRAVPHDAPPMPPADDNVTRVQRNGAAPVIAESEDDHEYVVGWLVVIDGPGKGNSREVFYGMNSMGRDIEERIPLNFGDTMISRNAHAFVVYDEKQRNYYLSHGGKTNLVRLNGEPVLSPLPLSLHDVIEIGESKLLFVPLCTDSFDWESSEKA